MCVKGGKSSGKENAKRERVGRSAQVYIIYELGVVLKCELNLSELNDSLNY